MLQGSGDHLHQEKRAMRAQTLSKVIVAIGFACSLVAIPSSAQDTAAQAAAIEELQANAWLASLENQLQLTGEQAGAFQVYAAAIRDQAKLKAAHRSSTLFVNTAKLPAAPEALAAKVEQVQERLASLKRVQGAAAKLYGVLAPQQRTMFDFLALTPMGIGSFEQP
jgi:hypothetical protein